MNGIAESTYQYAVRELRKAPLVLSNPSMTNADIRRLEAKFAQCQEVVNRYEQQQATAPVAGRHA